MVLLLTSYVNKNLHPPPQIRSAAGAPSIADHAILEARQTYHPGVQRAPVCGILLCRLSRISRNPVQSSGPRADLEHRRCARSAVRVAALVVLGLLRKLSRVFMDETQADHEHCLRRIGRLGIGDVIGRKTS